jgi:IS5 family transposase
LITLAPPSDASSRSTAQPAPSPIGGKARLQESYRKLVGITRQVVRQAEQAAVDLASGKLAVTGSALRVHTQVIRKGKAHKPTEFGRLVRVDEVENDIVSNYAVAAGNPSDMEQWAPALSQHQAQFGRAPRTATGDRGFWSAKNECVAREHGVERIALPARGPLQRRA